MGLVHTNFCTKEKASHGRSFLFKPSSETCFHGATARQGSFLWLQMSQPHGNAPNAQNSPPHLGRALTGTWQRHSFDRPTPRYWTVVSRSPRICSASWPCDEEAPGMMTSNGFNHGFIYRGARLADCATIHSTHKTWLCFFRREPAQ